jgi:hypothetical protein
VDRPQCVDEAPITAAFVEDEKSVVIHTDAPAVHEN